MRKTVVAVIVVTLLVLSVSPASASARSMVDQSEVNPLNWLADFLLPEWMTGSHSAKAGPAGDPNGNPTEDEETIAPELPVVQEPHTENG